MSSKTVKLTSESFDAVALAPGKTVLVDFWATWCPPCRALAPAIEGLAEERPDVTVGKLDVDEEPEIASRYGITNIPTILVFQDGQVVSRSVGLVRVERLRELVGGAPAEAASGRTA